MRPDTFPESNKTLGAPRGMEEECDPLAVWTDGKICASRWKMTWRERLAALVFGRVWLRVWSGQTQPPVSLEATRTIFIEPPWRDRARDFIRSAKRRMLPAAR